MAFLPALFDLASPAYSQSYFAAPEKGEITGELVLTPSIAAMITRDQEQARRERSTYSILDDLIVNESQKFGAPEGTVTLLDSDGSWLLVEFQSSKSASDEPDTPNLDDTVFEDRVVILSNWGDVLLADFSESGEILAIVDESNVVRVFDVKDRREVLEITTSELEILDVALDPKGTRVYILGESGLKVFDLNDSNLLLSYDFSAEELRHGRVTSGKNYSAAVLDYKGGSRMIVFHEFELIYSDIVDWLAGGEDKVVDLDIREGLTETYLSILRTGANFAVYRIGADVEELINAIAYNHAEAISVLEDGEVLIASDGFLKVDVETGQHARLRSITAMDGSEIVRYSHDLDNFVSSGPSLNEISSQWNFFIDEAFDRNADYAAYQASLQVQAVRLDNLLVDFPSAPDPNIDVPESLSGEFARAAALFEQRAVVSVLQGELEPATDLFVSAEEFRVAAQSSGWQTRRTEEAILLDQMSRGALEYFRPQSINYGTEAIASLKLSPMTSQSKNALEQVEFLGGEGTTKMEISYSLRTEAFLNGPSFSISPDEVQVRSILPSRVTEWEWAFAPTTTSKDSLLILEVRGVLERDGKSLPPFFIASFPDRIRIEVGIWHRITGLAQDISALHALLVAVVTTSFGALAWLWQRMRRKKKQRVGFRL